MTALVVVLALAVTQAAAAVDLRLFATRTQLDSFVAQFNTDLEFGNSAAIAALNAAGICSYNLTLVCGLVRVLVQHDPERLVGDDAMRSAAFLWHQWMRCVAEREAVASMQAALSAAAWSLRSALFGALPDAMIWPVAEFVNWAVDGLFQLTGMPSTTAFLIVASNIVMAKELTDLSATESDLEEIILPVRIPDTAPDKPVAAFYQQFHVEVQLYSRAMLLGDTNMLDLGWDAASYLNIADLEPIMFLISVLYRIPFQQRELRTACLERRLRTVRSSVEDSPELVLALSYYLQRDADAAVFIGEPHRLFKVLDTLPDGNVIEHYPLQSEVVEFLDQMLTESVIGLQPAAETPLSDTPTRLREWLRGSKVAVSSGTYLGRLYMLQDRNEPPSYEPVLDPIDLRQFVTHLKSLVPQKFGAHLRSM